jgi:cytochrome bd-type quinol oxidase subunit 2
MSHQRVVSCIMVLMAATGLLDAGHADAAAQLHLVVGVAVSYLGFLWYRGDSDARGFRRPRWLSVAVVAFTVAMIPWYLVRSRREGERGRALMAYAACLAAAAFAVWVGMAIHIGLT